MTDRRGVVFDRVIGGGDIWRKHVAEACTDLRLHCIPPRYDWGAEREVIRSGIAEILSLRLRIAYMPLLGGLEKIERKVGALADLRREPWAPAGHPVNRK